MTLLRSALQKAIPATPTPPQTKVPETLWTFQSYSALSAAEVREQVAKFQPFLPPPAVDSLVALVARVYDHRHGGEIFTYLLSDAATAEQVQRGAGAVQWARVE